MPNINNWHTCMVIWVVLLIIGIIEGVYIWYTCFMDMFHSKCECPKCGGSMFLRRSEYGEFYSCSRFPKCRGKLSIRHAYLTEKTEDIKRRKALAGIMALRK